MAKREIEINFSSHRIDDRACTLSEKEKRKWKKQKEIAVIQFIMQIDFVSKMLNNSIFTKKKRNKRKHERRCAGKCN